MLLSSTPVASRSNDAWQKGRALRQVRPVAMLTQDRLSHNLRELQATSECERCTSGRFSMNSRLNENDLSLA